MCSRRWSVLHSLRVHKPLLTVTVQSLSLDPRNNNGRQVDIKFNCMTCDEIRLISHGDKIGTNNYNLAKRYLATKYTNNVTIPFERI